MKKIVYFQFWWETERGWGERPDGYSLHLTVQDHKEWIRAYWKRMPDRVNGEAPDEYSYPCGMGYDRMKGDPIQVEINEKSPLYKQLIDNKKQNGIRGYREYSTDCLPQDVINQIYYVDEHRRKQKRGMRSDGLLDEHGKPWK